MSEAAQEAPRSHEEVSPKRLSDAPTIISSNFPTAHDENQVRHLLERDPEHLLWNDSPSPLAVMLPSVAKWVVIFLIFMSGLNYLNPGPLKPETQFDTVQEKLQDKADLKNAKAKAAATKAKAEFEASRSQYKKRYAEYKKKWEEKMDVYNGVLYVGLAVLLYQLYSHVAWMIRLKCIQYSMTSQRLTIRSGVFSKSVDNYELHRLGNGHVYKPWNMALFGRESLTYSNVGLYAILEAEKVRDLIRSAGQLEASRIDKANFR